MTYILLKTEILSNQSKNVKFLNKQKLSSEKKTDKEPYEYSNRLNILKINFFVYFNLKISISNDDKKN